MSGSENTLDFGLLEVPILEERPWAVFAACRDANPDLFFATTRDEVEAALALCDICTVREDCLEYALEARERFGIWGGSTDKQRRKLLRRSA